MKLPIFFLFTLSTLLGAYHARHIRDGCIYQSFDRRPPVKMTEVIQMVYGEEEQLSPPPPPLPPSWSNEDTIYGGDNPNAPPSQEVASSQDKTDNGGENLEGRPSPRRPPSDGQTTYNTNNPKAHLLPYVQTGYLRDYLNAQPSPASGMVPEGQTIYGRDNPNTPPPPKVAPSRGQTTYGRDNPNSKRHTLYDIVAILIPSYEKTLYGAQPSSNPAPSEKQVVYGLDKPKAPPSPQQVTPGGQTNGGDNPTTPLSPGVTDADKQGMLFESICKNGGSQCVDSISTLRWPEESNSAASSGVYF